jgi:hypothetical protein
LRTAPAKLEGLYQDALAAAPADPYSPSDICEHLPLLRELASRCEHVTEFGTRRANGSTVALLVGQPETLVTWDINPLAIYGPGIPALFGSGLPEDGLDWNGKIGRTEFQPRVGDTLKILIEPTDLLFIDSLHTYKQLYAELMRHVDPIQNKVRKWLAFHDTATFGQQGEDGSKPGLRAAVWHFQKQTFPLWGLKFDLQNNNGLIVLERVDVDPRPGISPNFYDEVIK